MNESNSSPSERVYCNHCRNMALHRVVGNADYQGEDEERGYWWSATFEMLQCGGCEEVVLRRTFRFSENTEDEISYFPPVASRQVPRWLYKLPNDLRLLLKEIYRSLDAENLRLPMMGARALVDMLIVEKVGDRGSFAEKLKELEKQGFISSHNGEVLDAVLEVGSAASHRGHAANESEAQSVMDIVENLLQAVYVFPSIAKCLKESTPPRPPRKKS